jgi:branched-chain amino acid transport system ATP-binding protein
MNAFTQTKYAQTAPTASRLVVDGLGKSFGGLRVFSEVSFVLESGSIFGVIGPNGAGKTTLINVICGALAGSAGRILLDGQDISAKPFHLVSRLGVLRSFQQTNTFAKATVEENLFRARHFSKGRPGPDVDLGPLIEEFGISQHFSEQSDSMAYGKQKMLGLLMALAPKPKFLLLDEPAAGLERRERTQVDCYVAYARETLGCGIMIVEHDMDLVKRLCPRILVLEAGRILADGAPAEVLSRPDVINAYLGADEE